MATHHQGHKMVTITRTTPVYAKPLPPQPNQTQMAPHLLSLSNLDRKCPLLMYLVFFYKKSHPHQNPSLGSLSNSLKLGLERILSVWFPAAGRLAINPTNQKLDLVCNNAGAILVEAVTQVKISELGDLSQYNSFFENLVFKPVFSENFSVMPLVVAQVTTFGCGGYAVGIGISHSLFDGQATFDFLNAWASTIAGRAGGSVQLIAPVHERGRLLVGHSQTQPRDRQLTRVVAFDHIYQLIEQAASTPSVDPDRMIGGCNFSELGPTSQEDCLLKTFSVSSAMIECLKRRVGCGRHIGACSSFEVVAAHLWKARTKALGLRNERKVCLQFTVDTRNKMSPPLPRSFSGNAYVLVSTASTAAELDEESIEATIGKIKEAKGVVTDDYVRAYIEALEAPQRALPPIRELTIVSDWTRTPFHTVDFGHGSAAYASPLGSPIPQVAYFMQSPNEAGAIDVRIGLHPQYVHAFYHYFLTMS